MNRSNHITKSNKSLLLWLLIVAGCAVGCRPRSVLSSSRMEQIIYQLHVADGTLQVLYHGNSPDTLQATMYQQILTENHTTQAQFDSSLVWYTNHPQFINKIYPRVIARLENEKKRVDEEVSATNMQFLPESATERYDTLRPWQEVMNEHLFGLQPIILQTKHGLDDALRGGS